MVICNNTQNCNLKKCRHISTHIWESDCDCDCCKIKGFKVKCVNIECFDDARIYAGLRIK
jgi:hypothetical protein